MKHDKLYLVTRSDLAPRVAAVQAAHALRQFGAEHPREDALWFETSNTLVLLHVEGEPQLRSLLADARFFDVPCSAFNEPDLGDQLTAVAIGPCKAAQRLTRRLPMSA